MRYKFIISFHFIVFIVFGCALFPSQKKFNAKENDSIFKKYTNFPELIKDRNKNIHEIDAILPRIDDNNVKFELIVAKASLYGTSIKDQPEVLKSHLQGLEIAEKLEGKRGKVIMHLALAETYKNLKMYQLATENLKAVEDLMAGESMNPEKTSMVFIGLFMELDLLFTTKKYPECIQKANYVLETANKLNVKKRSQLAEMLSYQFIGRSYLEMKNYPEAENYLKKAKTLENDALPDFKLRNTTAYAKLLYETKRVDEAKKVLENFHLKNLKDYPEEAVALFSILSKVYVKLGDNDKFDFYVKKKDSLDQAYKEVEMASVEQAQKYIEAENQKKVDFKDKIIWGLGPLVVLAIGFIFYLKRKKDSERKKFEKIINRIKNETTISETINEVAVEESVEKESSTSSLNAEKLQVILSQLSKFEEKEKFKDPNLSLADLAAQFKTNTSYLSEVVNKSKGKNFNAYINELRINYIVRKLYNNPEYLNFKISYLAEDCGFISHSSFATIFKSILGISPSTFIQNLKEES